MSYNGSGTFNINTAGQPVVTGTVISSTAFNALTSDLGTGLSTAITKDGQTTATARIPFAAGINSSLVTDATSTTTGSIITAGGAGIAKSLYVGLAANIAGGVDKLTTATGVVSVAAATAPTTGQVLTATSGTVATWQTPIGKIVQVIQSYIIGKASTSSTSRTILATSASITPSSASNKILFALYTAIGNDGATGNADFDIIRTVGATNTALSTDFNKQGATAAYQNDLFSYSMLDSPATTSAVTYSIRGFRSDGVAVPFVGGRATDTAYAIGVMFILQEVAA